MQTMADSTGNIGILDCTIKDFNTAATTLEEMAVLIQDVGFENLRRELGINISFDFEISDWIS